MQAEKEILIIDDNEILLSALKTLLESEGFKVATCSDPAAALVLAGGWAFDIFIVDYRLPRMNGDAVTAAIRKLHPAATIIGCSVESKEREFLAAGADTFIFKEKLPGELPVILRNHNARPAR